MNDAPPILRVEQRVIRENVERVLGRFDVEITGVTKAVCGNPQIGTAMLQGGVTRLADSRLANLNRLEAPAGVDLQLLRVPMLSELDDLLSIADLSFQSERDVIGALARKAVRAGTIHGVIPLVDLGDRREGILPGEFVDIAGYVEGLDGVKLTGVATHTGSFGGVLPTAESLESFAELVESCESAIGRPLPIVSGGSTVALPLAEQGTLPPRITDLRLGESLLLGTDVTRDRRIPYLANSAFRLDAEVIECRRKPSTPEGPTGHDSSGDPPTFRDRGERLRAVLALGEQDTDTAALTPLGSGFEVVGASSDHLILDVEDANPPPDIGDHVSFVPGYPALAQASASTTVRTELTQP